MDFNLLFSISIYLIIVFLIGVSLKVFIETKRRDRLNVEIRSVLISKLKLEEKQFALISDKLLLSDKFYIVIINRLFKITNELLLL